MKWFFFYDANFKPLRDNMVASNKDSFDVREDFSEDLGVMKNRAGGGVPTYLYKAQKIKDALDAAEEGECFLFTDVDVQFLRPVEAIVTAAAEGLDLVLQREFEDIGVNIGFCAVRKTQASLAFWQHVHSEILKTQALDQRVVNNTLYSGKAGSDFGLRWGRFPAEIWASSMAFCGPPPEGLAVHHANFTLERVVAKDPSLKLEQMAMVAAYDGGEKENMLEFVSAAQSNQSMLDYRDRHFGARRPGPEWATLPEGHIARPGGYREKKGARGGAGAAPAAEVSPAEQAVEPAPAAATEREEPC